MYDIDKKYGVPKEEISCPGCGRRYGHHKTKVCRNCEECSSCCRCGAQDLVDADIFIKQIL